MKYNLRMWNDTAFSTCFPWMGSWACGSPDCYLHWSVTLLALSHLQLPHLVTFVEELSGFLVPKRGSMYVRPAHPFLLEKDWHGVTATQELAQAGPCGEQCYGGGEGQEGLPPGPGMLWGQSPLHQ